MIQTTTAPVASAPEDRSTTFQPVEGGNEVHSGTTLMVEAYAAIWMIIMLWLVFVWRKQAALHQRVDELEHAIDRAAAKQAAAAKDAK
jgi:CcmD family protein